MRLLGIAGILVFGLTLVMGRYLAPVNSALFSPDLFGTYDRSLYADDTPLQMLSDYDVDESSELRDPFAEIIATAFNDEEESRDYETTKEREAEDTDQDAIENLAAWLSKPESKEVSSEEHEANLNIASSEDASKEESQQQSQEEAQPHYLLQIPSLDGFSGSLSVASDKDGTLLIEFGKTLQSEEEIHTENASKSKEDSEEDINPDAVEKDMLALRPFLLSHLNLNTNDIVNINTLIGEELANSVYDTVSSTTTIPNDDSSEEADDNDEDDGEESDKPQSVENSIDYRRDVMSSFSQSGNPDNFLFSEFNTNAKQFYETHKHLAQKLTELSKENDLMCLNFILNAEYNNNYNGDLHTNLTKQLNQMLSESDEIRNNILALQSLQQKLNYHNLLYALFHELSAQKSIE